MLYKFSGLLLYLIPIAASRCLFFSDAAYFTLMLAYPMGDAFIPYITLSVAALVSPKTETKN